MRTLLITGAAGQVGNRLLTELNPIGRIIATDVVEMKVPGITFHRLDLTDNTAISDLIRTVRPDAIVNPAAYTAVDKAESEPDLVRKVNADAVRCMAIEAKSLGIPLVHYSTDYVFDGSGDRPWTEQDRTGPLNVYGHTKLEGELALAAVGCTHIILRTSWVYSDYGSNFVRTMLRLGSEREEVRVVNDQVGAPTSAAVLARMTRHILECAFRLGERAFASYTGVYHLTTSGATSWHGFATAIFAKARDMGFQLKVRAVHPIPSEAYPLPARRPRNSRLDCSKFVDTFGAQLERWDVALEEVILGFRRQSVSQLPS